MNTITSKPRQPLTEKTSLYDGEIRSNIKELLMEFHAFSKNDLTYVLELCEYSLEAAQAYLRKTPKKKVNATISGFLLGEIEPGSSVLGIAPHLLVPKEVKKEEEVKKEVEEWVPTGPNLFETKLTSELVHYIFEFLDAFSLGKIGPVCKWFQEISLHPLLFKKFCKKLYPQHPPFPSNTPFNTLLHRINNAPLGEFHPRFIQRANFDIRAIVWMPSVKSFYTPASFYKQFKTMKGIFLHAPRVRFGGVYMMKEKYIRAGAKDLIGFYDPYHVIEFFRYFRFFPDGLVMSTLSVNKLKNEKLVKVFTPGYQEDDSENQNPNQKSGIKSVLQGEYMIQKSSIHVRLNAETTIYEFLLEIEPSAPGMFNQIRLVSQHLRYIESEYSEPIQNKYMGSKIFKFAGVPSFLKDIEDDLQGIAF